jgi:Na+-driven multidrug efflux pump
MKVSVLAFFIMLISNTLLVAKWGVEGSALALLIVMLFVMLTKQMVLMKFRKTNIALQGSIP